MDSHWRHVVTADAYGSRERQLAAALAGDSQIDAVVTLGAPQIGEPAVLAVKDARRPIMVASFDLSPGFL